MPPRAFRWEKAGGRRNTAIYNPKGCFFAGDCDPIAQKPTSERVSGFGLLPGREREREREKERKREREREREKKREREREVEVEV